MAPNKLTPRRAIVAGSIAIVCGVVPILGGMGVISGARADVPRWIPILCGCLFVLAGVSIMLTSGAAGGLDAKGAVRSDSPYAIQLVQYLLIVTLLGAMMIIAGWIAFGPGERAFQVETSSGGLSAGQGDHSAFGRIAFGASTLLLGVMFIYAAVSGARRLRSRARQVRDSSLSA